MFAGNLILFAPKELNSPFLSFNEICALTPSASMANGDSPSVINLF